MHSSLEKYKERQKPHKPFHEMQSAKVNIFPSNQFIHLISPNLSPIRISQYPDSPPPKHIHILEKSPRAQPINLPVSTIFGPKESPNTSSSYIAKVAHHPTRPIAFGSILANDPPNPETWPTTERECNIWPYHGRSNKRRMDGLKSQVNKI